MRDIVNRKCAANTCEMSVSSCSIRPCVHCSKFAEKVVLVPDQTTTPVIPQQPPPAASQWMESQLVYTLIKAFQERVSDQFNFNA